MKPIAIRHIPLEQQVKHSESSLRDTEAMLMLRFSTVDWTDKFAQFRRENELRKG